MLDLLGWIIGQTTPSHWLDDFRMMGVSMLLYLIMQIVALAYTDGLWRSFSSLPLFLMLFTFIVIVIDGGNLAPLFLFFVAPTAFFYMCFFYVIWFANYLYRWLHISSNRQPQVRKQNRKKTR